MDVMEKRILIPITTEEINQAVIGRADIWGQQTGAELRLIYQAADRSNKRGVFIGRNVGQ